MDIREAIEAFDIRNWLSEKTRVFKSGPTNISASLCPICGKRGGKFYARADGGERNGSFTAYCCGNIGSLTLLVELVEGISRSDALDFIKDRVAQESDAVIPLVPLHIDEYVPPKINLPSPVYFAYPDYVCWVKDHWGTLRDRGVDEYVIQRHHLMLTQIGTTYAGDDRRDLDHRLLIPVIKDGSLLSWQARDLGGTAKRKYLFPAGDRSSEWLYGLDQFAGDTILIVEGVFHKWAWDRLGIMLGDSALERCSVASFGKKLTQAQRGIILQRSDIRNVVFAWDIDAAAEVGRAALEMTGKKAVYVMPSHPSGRDHDELTHDELAEMWKTVEPYSTSLEIRMKTALAAQRAVRL